MITENLQTLKIHKLSGEQYKRELESGNADVTALYLTPADEDKYIIPVNHYLDTNSYVLDSRYVFDFGSLADMCQRGRNVICRVYVYQHAEDAICVRYFDFGLVQYELSGRLLFSNMSAAEQMLELWEDGTIGHLITEYLPSNRGGEVHGTVTLNSIQLKNGINFGTEAQLEALENPVEGQLFFVIE